MTEALMDRCRSGHMCPTAEHLWAVAQEAREDDVALATTATRTRAAVTMQTYRAHKYPCERSCPTCEGGGRLMKGEDVDAVCWRCKGTGEL